MGGSSIDTMVPSIDTMVYRPMVYRPMATSLISSLKSFDKTCKAQIELMKDIFSPEKQKIYTSDPLAVLKKVEMIDTKLNNLMVEIGIHWFNRSRIDQLAHAEVEFVKSMYKWVRPDDAETSLKNNYSKLSLAIESLVKTYNTFSEAMNKTDPIILPIMSTQEENEVIKKVEFIKKEITDLIDKAVRKHEYAKHKAYLDYEADVKAKYEAEAATDKAIRAKYQAEADALSKAMDEAKLRYSIDVSFQSK
jgi:hypothetical protein